MDIKDLSVTLLIGPLRECIADLPSPSSSEEGTASPMESHEAATLGHISDALTLSEPGDDRTISLAQAKALIAIAFETAQRDGTEAFDHTVEILSDELEDAILASDVSEYSLAEQLAYLWTDTHLKVRSLVIISKQPEGLDFLKPVIALWLRHMLNDNPREFRSLSEHPQAIVYCFQVLTQGHIELIPNLWDALDHRKTQRAFLSMASPVRLRGELPPRSRSAISGVCYSKPLPLVTALLEAAPNLIKEQMAHQLFTPVQWSFFKADEHNISIDDMMRLMEAGGPAIADIILLQTQMTEPHYETQLIVRKLSPRKARTFMRCFSETHRIRLAQIYLKLSPHCEYSLPQLIGLLGGELPNGEMAFSPSARMSVTRILKPHQVHELSQNLGPHNVLRLFQYLGGEQAKYLLHCIARMPGGILGAIDAYRDEHTLKLFEDNAELKATLWQRLEEVDYLSVITDTQQVLNFLTYAPDIHRQRLKVFLCGRDEPDAFADALTIDFDTCKQILVAFRAIPEEQRWDYWIDRRLALLVNRITTVDELSDIVTEFPERLIVKLFAGVDTAVIAAMTADTILKLKPILSPTSFGTFWGRCSSAQKTRLLRADSVLMIRLLPPDKQFSVIRAFFTKHGQTQLILGKKDIHGVCLLEALHPSTVDQMRAVISSENTFVALLSAFIAPPHEMLTPYKLPYMENLAYLLAMYRLHPDRLDSLGQLFMITQADELDDIRFNRLFPVINTEKYIFALCILAIHQGHIYAIKRCFEHKRFDLFARSKSGDTTEALIRVLNSEKAEEIIALLEHARRRRQSTSVLRLQTLPANDLPTSLTEGLYPDEEAPTHTQLTEMLADASDTVIVRRHGHLCDWFTRKLTAFDPGDCATKATKKATALAYLTSFKSNMTSPDWGSNAAERKRIQIKFETVYCCANAISDDAFFDWWFSSMDGLNMCPGGAFDALDELIRTGPHSASLYKDIRNGMIAMTQTTVNRTLRNTVAHFDMANQTRHVDLNGIFAILGLSTHQEPDIFRLPPLPVDLQYKIAREAYRVQGGTKGIVALAMDMLRAQLAQHHLFQTPGEVVPYSTSLVQQIEAILTYFDGLSLDMHTIVLLDETTYMVSLQELETIERAIADALHVQRWVSHSPTELEYYQAELNQYLSGHILSQARLTELGTFLKTLEGWTQLTQGLFGNATWLTAVEPGRLFSHIPSINCSILEYLAADSIYGQAKISGLRPKPFPQYEHIPIAKFAPTSEDEIALAPIAKPYFASSLPQLFLLPGAAQTAMALLAEWDPEQFQLISDVLMKGSMKTSTVTVYHILENGTRERVELQRETLHILGSYPYSLYELIRDFSNSLYYRDLPTAERIEALWDSLFTPDAIDTSGVHLMWMQALVRLDDRKGLNASMLHTSNRCLNTLLCADETDQEAILAVLTAAHSSDFFTFCRMARTRCRGDLAMQAKLTRFIHKHIPRSAPSTSDVVEAPGAAVALVAGSTNTSIVSCAPSESGEASEAAATL